MPAPGPSPEFSSLSKARDLSSRFAGPIGPRFFSSSVLFSQRHAGHPLKRTAEVCHGLPGLLQPRCLATAAQTSCTDWEPPASRCCPICRSGNAATASTPGRVRHQHNRGEGHPRPGRWKEPLRPRRLKRTDASSRALMCTHAQRTPERPPPPAQPLIRAGTGGSELHPGLAPGPAGLTPCRRFPPQPPRRAASAPCAG